MIDSQAKRFGIFCWIYAGLISLCGISGIISLIVLLNDVRSSPVGNFSYDQLMVDLNRPWGAYHYMFFAFVGYVLLAAVFTLASIISNVLLGKRLRSAILPSKGSIIRTSILSAVSPIFIGLLFFPVGLALCIYGIWFASVNRDRFQTESI